MPSQRLLHCREQNIVAVVMCDPSVGNDTHYIIG
jgi:hypothetical protein